VASKATTVSVAIVDRSIIDSFSGGEGSLRWAPLQQGSQARGRRGTRRQRSAVERPHREREVEAAGRELGVLDGVELDVAARAPLLERVALVEVTVKLTDASP